MMAASTSTSSNLPIMGNGTDYTIGKTTSKGLPKRIPPLQDDCVLHGGLPSDSDPNIILTQSAVTQIQRHCESNLRVELGGVLLGVAYNHGGQVYVEVKAAIPAKSTENGPVHFTFTADAWSQLHVDRAAYPDLVIVGWFHTHPDLGVFFSADDEVVQQAAFTQPWHVALVVDPVNNNASFFGWRGGHIGAFDGYYEYIPATSGDPDQVPRSVVPWDVNVDASWMMTSAETHSQADFSQADHSPTYMPQYDDPLDFGPISPWVGAILGGASLVVSLITLYLVLRQNG